MHNIFYSRQIICTLYTSAFYNTMMQNSSWAAQARAGAAASRLVPAHQIKRHALACELMGRDEEKLFAENTARQGRPWESV